VYLYTYMYVYINIYLGILDYSFGQEKVEE
jgi:hypothetical protein